MSNEPTYHDLAHTFEISTPAEFTEAKKRFDEWYGKATPEEQNKYFNEKEIKTYNEKIGNLGFITCSKCKNKGRYKVIEDNEVVPYRCECMDRRDTLRRIEECGLGDKIRSCTFASFIASDEWQTSLKAKAQEYAENPNKNWFYIGGQVGCGKTHLCTGIVITLINNGNAARYIVWREELRKLQQAINGEYEYTRAIDEIKQVKVLYIDDFLKSVNGSVPTDSELKIAFEIINYRYNNTDLITIISSEKTANEITAIDEAIGSRIYERAKRNGYCFSVGKDANKNFRLKL